MDGDVHGDIGMDDMMCRSSAMERKRLGYTLNITIIAA